MLRAFTSLIPAALLVMLSACGSDHIEVERTAALPVLQANFVVIPSKTQDKAKDYSKYADLITTDLSRTGLHRVEDAAQARYGLMFSYDGDGAERGSDDRHRGIGEKKYSDGKVARTVSIMIYDLTRPRLINEAVFGGYAECPVDSLRRDPIVMPAMFDAILKDFPGEGRETYKADLPSMK